MKYTDDRQQESRRNPEEHQGDATRARQQEERSSAAGDRGVPRADNVPQHEGEHRLDEDRQQHDEAEKDSEYNRQQRR